MGRVLSFATNIQSLNSPLNVKTMMIKTMILHLECWFGFHHWDQGVDLPREDEKNCKAKKKFTCLVCLKTRVETDWVDHDYGPWKEASNDNSYVGRTCSRCLYTKWRRKDSERC